MREKQVGNGVGAPGRDVKPVRMLGASVYEKETSIPTEVSLEEKKGNEEIDHEKPGYS
jgi:hypothetical protein